MPGEESEKGGGGEVSMSMPSRLLLYRLCCCAAHYSVLRVGSSQLSLSSQLTAHSSQLRSSAHKSFPAAVPQCYRFPDNSRQKKVGKTIRNSLKVEKRKCVSNLTRSSGKWEGHYRSKHSLGTSHSRGLQI